MYKFQYKISILNFLTCANLHMIEKPFFLKQNIMIFMPTITISISQNKIKYNNNIQISIQFISNKRKKN